MFGAGCIEQRGINEYGRSAERTLANNFGSREAIRVKAVLGSSPDWGLGPKCGLK